MENISSNASENFHLGEFLHWVQHALGDEGHKQARLQQAAAKALLPFFPGLQALSIQPNLKKGTGERVFGPHRRERIVLLAEFWGLVEPSRKLHEVEGQSQSKKQDIWLDLLYKIYICIYILCISIHYVICTYIYAFVDADSDLCEFAFLMTTHAKSCLQESLKYIQVA